MHLTKFQINWPCKTPHCILPCFKSIGLLVQVKKRKKDFQDSSLGSLRFSIRTILAIFDQQVTLMLPTKIQIKEVKNRISRWWPRWPSWIFNRKDFSYFFYLQVNPKLPTKFQVHWLFSSGEAKNKFKDGGHGSHLGFQIGTILGIFDVEVTPMFPTKFQVNWPLGS